MLKIVVYDSGFGGELFADYLEEELPIVEVIRVIDWRNADKILLSPKTARQVACNALRPYFGKVDLIIFANHLLTITSLKFFQRKYKSQKFLGFSLKEPDTFVKRDVLILTTKALAKTIDYRSFIFHLKRKTKTLTLDTWPNLIDDGELSETEIKSTIKTALLGEKFLPQELILACSQFNDIKPTLKKLFGPNVRIYDSFDEAYSGVCHILRIRGGVKKRK